MSISSLADAPWNCRCHDAGSGPIAPGWSRCPNCTVSDVGCDMDLAIGLLGLGSPWLGEICNREKNIGASLMFEVIGICRRIDLIFKIDQMFIRIIHLTVLKS